MSNDEEMQIRGRMVTDHAEAKKRRIILKEERGRIGKLVERVGTYMQYDLPEKSATFTDEMFTALNPAKIKELLEETKQNNEEIQDLQEKLNALGLL